MASNSEQDLSKKTVVDLKSILRQGGQSTTGTKPILIQRIIETNLYTPPPPAVVPTHIIAPAGQPVYEPVPDEALRIRESLHAFILDHFNEEDFDRAPTLDEDDRWFEIGSYENFIQLQAEELAQMDLPLLSCLNNIASLIQANKIDMMHELSMTAGMSSNGFILIDGKLIMTHPR